MPEYASASALLMDAEMRADGLGSSAGIIVVEGPDDKRIFVRHVHDSAQILPAGGRTLLLSAYEKATDEQRQKVLFVTDCDYEVRRGNLRGAPDLIITTLTDMESDLLALGVMQSLVLELIPRALDSNDACKRITARLRNEAEEIALPLGRLRMAAQPLGIPLKLEELKISRYWDSSTQTFDFTKLVRAMHTKVSSIVDLGEWSKLAEASPSDRAMCHGKDLLRALSFLLKDNYGVDVSPDVLAKMMRSSLTGDDLENWDVIRRIRVWQNINRRNVLRN
ncbi:hypothetical protein AB0O75_48375 [Streptomyces sp. NPDC088921]|uniref:hypothetical protein n=1 Tax=unclassified Streptomyces TaxID=2593676 RepID=UPI00342FC28F